MSPPRCPLKGHFPLSKSVSFSLWSSLNSSSCHYTHLSPVVNHLCQCNLQPFWKQFLFSLNNFGLSSRSFWLSMKRSFSSAAASKAKTLQKNAKTKDEEVVIIDWEVRPGGLLVQKRGIGTGNAAGPMIKIKVSHDSSHHNISVPSQSTFGDVKRILANTTGLEPTVQRLLFRGKEKDDDECLHIAGVEDMSKLILVEDPASKERKFEEMRKNQANKAHEAVAKVKAEVDKLSDKVLDLEKAVQNGIKILDKEFVVLIELLMMQLLNLDSIEANGEAREQRRTEVHRVQSFVDKLDNLKARNSANGFSNCGGTASFVTTKWETFDSGVGSLTAPTSFHHSTKVFEDWELFD